VLHRPLTALRAVPRLTGRRAAAAAVGLGALSVLALPPISLVPVLLLTIPGLLAMIGASAGVRQAGWIGFGFGFGFYLVGLYWITNAVLVMAAEYWWLVPLAVPAVALVLAPFIALPCALARLVAPGWRRIAVLAGAWVMADLARQFVLTGFPWNPLGSVWEMPGWLGTVFIQPAAWISVHGLTLLTVLLAAMPALGRRGWAAGAVGLALWFGLGAARLRQPDPAPGDLRVVLVQGDIAEGHVLDQAFALQSFRRYLALTRDGVDRAGPGRSVVIWPESASPFLLTIDNGARRAIMDAAQPAVAALVGSVRFPQGVWTGKPDNRPRNSLIALTDHGAIAAIYDKWHLVPGGEYAPAWFPFGIQLVPGGGFAPGPGPRTLHVPGLPPVGPLICYEAVFPGQGVDERDRPAWLVNVTNDAWFGNSLGPRQHLAAARMRAVEEGLPLVRAANTGISAAFDSRGRPLGRLGLGRTGTLIVALPGALPPTPFARWGLVLPFLLALGCLSLGLSVTRKRPVGT